MKVNALLIFFLFFTVSAFSQKSVYWTTGGELIFSWGRLEYTDGFKLANPTAEIADNPVRFTCFLHVGQNVHKDFNNNIGFYSGIGVRNIGMISDESLPNPANPASNLQAKIIRRTYTIGIPLAIKLGSFDDNFFLYGGGEIEWAFHMKEKWWNEHNRDGNKTKNTDWFASDRINPLLPSVLAGIQFPGGLNIKFKYYLTDFLNHDYKPTSSNPINDMVSDLTKYQSSQLLYISLSYHIKDDRIIKTQSPTKIAMAY